MEVCRLDAAVDAVVVHHLVGARIVSETEGGSNGISFAVCCSFVLNHFTTSSGSVAVPGQLQSKSMFTRGRLVPVCANLAHVQIVLFVEGDL